MSSFNSRASENNCTHKQDNASTASEHLSCFMAQCPFYPVVREGWETKSCGTHWAVVGEFGIFSHAVSECCSNKHQTWNTGGMMWSSLWSWPPRRQGAEGKEQKKSSNTERRWRVVVLSVEELARERANVLLVGVLHRVAPIRIHYAD